MAFIVEDGTGLSNANAYVSVADADSYNSDRGNTLWSDLSTQEKEQAIVRATDYMVQVYRLRWKGYRVLPTQALDMPRSFMIIDDFQYAGLNGYTIIGGNYYYPNNIVPTEVKNACIELAMRASQGELNPDLTQGVIREKVDVIEVTYDQYSSQSPRYKAIDNMLQPFFSGSQNSHRVVRA